MAPMHSGFLEEYPLIRVDNFTSVLPRLPPSLPRSARQDLPEGATHFSPPHISFLSHTHTDHLAGLSTLSRQSAPIYCSEVTKRLLLNLERKADRERFDAGQGSRKRPYQLLRRSQKECQLLEKKAGTPFTSGWDLLHCLAFNDPVVLSYTAKSSIRVTLLPANHMPGSAMILIEGERGAVLHTGDLRGEEHFVRHLLAQSHLNRLSSHIEAPEVLRLENGHCLPHDDDQHDDDEDTSSVELRRLFHPNPRLANIYLDTEKALDVGIPLSKSEAIYDVLQLLQLFPHTTQIHIGCWTSGYEEFLLGLATSFASQVPVKVHVDRYRMGLYQTMATEPHFKDLARICSTDRSDCPRFCACEDPKCVEASNVRIEASECMDVLQWKEAKSQLLSRITEARSGRGSWPARVSLPLQRHSPLRELYSMIKLLQPVKVTANTAHCQARFILAQLSRSLNLGGAHVEIKRQRELTGCQGRSDEAEWERCSQAWEQSGSDEIHNTSDEDFFSRVARFRRICNVLDRSRIAKECMDAEESPASIGLAIAVSSAHKTQPAGPWNGQGRYATVDSSPFLTPAMRRSVSAMTIATCQQQEEKASREVSGPNGTAILSTELASRYIAYASMFLGWKIRNPSQYHPPIAWKAIRKMKPELARKSEEALKFELGLAIPPWDDQSSRIESSLLPPAFYTKGPSDTLSVPSTPPLRATGISTAPATPTGRVMMLHESISPLQLGAAALIRRLDEEAASQEFSALQGSEGEECNVELIHVGFDAELMESPSAIPTVELAKVELHLRGCNGYSRLYSEQGQCGARLFNRIIDEWKLSQNQPVNLLRFSHQLNLVGVAVRSCKGRSLLCWEDVDFRQAYNSLRRIYSRADPSLPSRGRKVLRYLRRSLNPSMRP